MVRHMQASLFHPRMALSSLQNIVPLKNPFIIEAQEPVLICGEKTNFPVLDTEIQEGSSLLTSLNQGVK